MIRLVATTLLFVLFTATSAGAQATVATGVSADATDANSQPKIGRDGRGTIHLVFVRPVSGVEQVFVGSSRDGGRSWQTRQITAASVESRYPTLAVGPDDQVHLAWTQYDGGVGKVYYSRFNGTRWTVPVKISPGTAYAGVPSIAVERDGTVHLVWYGIREQAPAVRTRHGSIYEILYSGAPGGRWSKPEVISPGIPDSINPTLGVDARDRLHSAWYQFDIRSYQVQHAVRTVRWNLPDQVSSGNDDAFSVAMGIGPNSSVYLVWERRSASDIRINFGERHERWTVQQPLSPAGQRALNPSVAADERNHLYAAWEVDGQIYLRRWEAQWLPPERLTSEGENANPILASGRGAVDLMWTQKVAGEQRLRFATIAGLPGGRTGTASRSPWGLILLVLILVAGVSVWRRMRALRVTRD